jgi:hypothetical protein
VDGPVLGILGFVAILVLLDVAALRFGEDSRTWTRELPQAGDAAPPFPRRPRFRLRPARARLGQGWTVAPIRDLRIAERPWPTPTRPFVPRPVCYQRFDLAAAGK